MAITQIFQHSRQIFARDASKIYAEVPAWNLNLVLYMITKEPFEPLQKATTKDLTLKTVFLVSLATAKNCGEIHALRRNSIKWSENQDTVYLYPDPSFISKKALLLTKDLGPFLL